MINIPTPSKIFKKSKGFIILFAIYVLMLILDVVSTLKNAALLPHIEVNPIYQAVGTLWPVLLLNIIITILIYYAYTHKKTTPSSRYLIHTFMILTIFLRIIAVHNAIEWHHTTMSIEEVEQKYTSEVRAVATKQFALITYVPLLMMVLPFLFWRLDHYVVRKDAA